MKDKRYAELAEKFEDTINSYVEYEETHEDSGSNYAHLVKEGWTYRDDDRLEQFLTENNIPATKDERESLAEAIREDCEFYPSTIYSRIHDREFVVDYFAVGEIEDQYSLPDLTTVLDTTSEDETLAFVALAVRDNRFCLLPNGDGGVLSYTVSDAVWQFVVDCDWIRDRLDSIRD